MPLVSVADHGPGIPAEERKQVLKRFYRLERGRHTLGNGLGLSLVAVVANMHECSTAPPDWYSSSGFGVLMETSLRNSSRVRAFGDQPIRFACAAYSGPTPFAERTKWIAPPT
jgi:nitrogen-specific signal transduction histidine kinase